MADSPTQAPHGLPGTVRQRYRPRVPRSRSRRRRPGQRRGQCQSWAPGPRATCGCVAAAGPRPLPRRRRPPPPPTPQRMQQERTRRPLGGQAVELGRVRRPGRGRPRFAGGSAGRWDRQLRLVGEQGAAAQCGEAARALALGRAHRATRASAVCASVRSSTWRSTTTSPVAARQGRECRSRWTPLHLGGTTARGRSGSASVGCFPRSTATPPGDVGRRRRLAHVGVRAGLSPALDDAVPAPPRPSRAPICARSSARWWSPVGQHQCASGRAPLPPRRASKPHEADEAAFHLHALSRFTLTPSSSGRRAERVVSATRRQGAVARRPRCPGPGRGSGSEPQIRTPGVRRCSNERQTRAATRARTCRGGRQLQRNPAVARSGERTASVHPGSVVTLEAETIHVTAEP